MKNAMGTWPLACLLALLAVVPACGTQPVKADAGAGETFATATVEAPIPKLVGKSGRHALLVDGHRQHRRAARVKRHVAS